MNAEKNKILKQFKSQLIQNFGNDIQDVILFGSQVTGKVHEDSDYDILIILKSDDDRYYRNNILDIVYDFELKYDIFIDFKIITTQELENSIRGKQPFFQDAIENGIYL